MRAPRVVRVAILVGLLGGLLTPPDDAGALNISVVLGDGSFNTFAEFTLPPDGRVRLRNTTRTSTTYTPGEYSFIEPGLPLDIRDPSSGSGSATFVYENTLTLTSENSNSQTLGFSRTLDVTWGTFTEVTFERVGLTFDLGEDGLVPVELPEETRFCGTNCSSNLQIAYVPEPSTALLLAAALLGLAYGRRHQSVRWIA